MFAFIVVVHVIVCLVLVVVILLQAGSGGGITDIFGGGGGGMPTILGTQAPTFLKRMTAVCAIVFLFTCMGLVVLSRGKTVSLVDQGDFEDPAVMPVLPDIDEQGMPAGPDTALPKKSTTVTETLPDGTKKITETAADGTVTVTEQHPRPALQQPGEVAPDVTMAEDLKTPIQIDKAVPADEVPVE